MMPDVIMPDLSHVYKFFHIVCQVCDCLTRINFFAIICQGDQMFNCNFVCYRKWTRSMLIHKPNWSHNFCLIIQRSGLGYIFPNFSTLLQFLPFSNYFALTHFNFQIEWRWDQGWRRGQGTTAPSAWKMKIQSPECACLLAVCYIWNKCACHYGTAFWV